MLRTTAFRTVAILSLLAPAAMANTGVSDDRVVLPDGPGSVEGVGENVEIDPNMGAMRHSVKMVLPHGFPKMTPDLALKYSSSAGLSVAGVGWSFSVPSVERLTSRGLPEFLPDDEFAANGGEELVLTETSGTTQTYRARYEKEFVRYTWHDVGTGAAGYFTGEYPDGRMGYFGADSSGTLVPASRVERATGETFRYMLVEMVDPWGHRIRYDYTKDGEYPLVSEIGYVYTTGSTPRFSVQLTYEAREDVVSDCSPGFDLQLTQRLASVAVSSGSEVIRSYALSYEDYALSGGFSRLSEVQQYGRGGLRYGITQSFRYSRALGGTCDGTTCEQPFMVDMGTLPAGFDMRTGNSTLIDMNGDSLPDFLYTGTDGAHQFIINQPSTDGRPTFGTSVVYSQRTQGGSSFILQQPGVQTLDVNGDGFTDLVSSRTAEVLCNDAEGDWADHANCIQNSTLPQMQEDADDIGDLNPNHVRFFDYDNDKRIDMLQTTAADAATVYHNTGTDFVPITVQAIGAQFDESRLDLSDMNGDGMQDPVEVLTGNQIRYRLNLGFGTWGDWITVDLQGLDATAMLNAQLEDINGDGLSDVVVVVGNTVNFAINRNGDHFDDFITLQSADVQGDLPSVDPETTVLFADMNGNGSDDVVWVNNQSGAVQFLELFPVKPNLLARIENGIGMVQTAAYGTAVAELARDLGGADAWRYKLPNSMNVVVAKDTWVTLTGSDDGTGLHELEQYMYRHGFYDGDERQFRGFAYVEKQMVGDADQDGQEPSLVRFEFDVGAEDPYYNGLMLSQSVLAGATDWEPLQQATTEYADCDVAGVPTTGLLFDVRHVCRTAHEVVHQERAASGSWLTTRTEWDYNGYGQVTEERRLGRTDETGDELTTTTEYVEPGTSTGGAWFTDKAFHVTESGSAAGPAKETWNYYDGPDYIGLGLGELTQGAVTRVEKRIASASDATINAERNRFDDDGNLVETIDPLGSSTDADNHRRIYTIDSTGLNVVRVELRLTDQAGEPYQLVREFAYEDSFNKVSRATTWTAYQGGTALTPESARSYRYDAHGRIIKLLEPGDQESTPTQEYTYELGDPWTRIGIHQRSVPGGSIDVERVRCVDGRGRDYQQRTKLSDGAWEVNGFRVLNSRGKPVVVYEPYEAADGECEAEAPADVPFTSYRYDGLDREILMTYPDADAPGGASAKQVVYGPLQRIDYDENDNDPSSPAHDTPTTYTQDGLERLVSIERDLGGTMATILVEYDELGRVAAVSDAVGNRRIQDYDLLDRVVQIDAPNSGVTTFDYDAAGNVIQQEDGAGVVTISEYEGANRLVARWDEADKAGTVIETTYDWLESCSSCTNSAGQVVAQSYPIDPSLGDSGEDRLGYDVWGNQIWSERRFGTVAFEVEKTYDAVGRLTGVVYPDGDATVFEYDGGARVTGIEGVIDRVDYDPRGLKSRIVHANGVETTYDYDSRRRITSLSTTLDSDVLFELSFERDRVGNIVEVADGSDASSDRPSLDASYGYDAWYRLMSADLAGDEALTYAYDLIDNMTLRESDRGNASPAHVGALTYDDARPNAVAQAGTVDLDYDGAGRLTTRGTRSFTWDHLGRMTSVAGDDPGTFVYGADETRVAKLEDGGVTYYAASNFVVRDGIATTYIRLGQEYVARVSTDSLATSVLEDLDGDDAITVGDALVAAQDASDDVALERLLRAAARRVVYAAGEPVTHLHADHLGTIVQATTSDGAVRGEQGFYPYGALRYSSGFVDEHGFTGQEFDPSSGTFHFKYRELDPGTGRWLRPDPEFLTLTPENVTTLGEAMVEYSYVANNPVNATDPTGLGGPEKTKGKDAKGAKGAKSAKASKKAMYAVLAVQIATTLTATGLAIAAAVEEGKGDEKDDRLIARLTVSEKSFEAVGSITELVGTAAIEHRKEKEEKAAEAAQEKAENQKSAAKAEDAHREMVRAAGGTSMAEYAHKTMVRKANAQDKQKARHNDLKPNLAKPRKPTGHDD